MIVWISSIKRIILPAAWTSLIILLILSSNSPLYFEPATVLVKSRINILLSSIVSGTSPASILCAIASIIAVLPTPGSPIRHGLFFVLLLKTWITLWISVSLPTTGSNLFSCASLVKSLPNCSNVGTSDLLTGSFLPCLTYALNSLGSLSVSFKISMHKFFKFRPKLVNILFAWHSESAIIASKTCSVPTSFTPILPASSFALSKTPWLRDVNFKLFLEILLFVFKISCSVMSSPIALIISWASSS